MADIKESQLTQSGNIGQLRAIDTQGNSIQCTVDQLTDKMRIATGAENGLMPKRLVPTYTAEPINCNEKREIASRISGYRWINAPHENGYGELFVGGYSGDWCYQEITYLNEYSFSRYRRRFHSGTTWCDWIQVF